MIYTLTLNTAIDMNITTQGLLPNKVNRTQSVKYSPNGKGVNVSVVLRHNEIRNRIIGVFGGFSGRYIVDELNVAGHEVSPVWVEEPTRINVFAHDGQDEFKLVSPGSFVSREKQKEMLSMIKHFTDMDYLVISGSLPPGVELSFYDELMVLLKSKGVKVVLDISSTKLEGLLKYEPLLIKPNDDELKEVFGLDIKDVPIVEVMSVLHNKGAQNVLLTMGAQGLYFSDGSKIYGCDSPKITLLSSACAGDACLGAFLSEWLLGGDIEYALKKASATGANVAESEGIGALENVASYIKKVNVKTILQEGVL